MNALMAALISCCSISVISDVPEMAALGSGGSPMMTGTNEAATGAGTPAEVNAPTTDVLNRSCGDRLGNRDDRGG